MSDSAYMQRCIELAELGSGKVAPNPMVGAVLVHDGKIIGEGYHQEYGQAHAEVNCINAVLQGDRDKIQHSVLYVSLEPCSHFGKTPPCTDLIIKNKIPRVVIGCSDPFKEVNGKGIEKLKAAGLEVKAGIMEKECRILNKRFFTFCTGNRPFIILKWAETADGRIAAPPPPKGGILEGSKQSRLLISNENSNRLVHKWRSEEAAILVGTNTALLDDPELTNRYWPGGSPLRMVLDMELKLPSSLKMFNDGKRTVIFNSVKHMDEGNISYYKLNSNENIARQIASALFDMKIQSVMVEGGAKMIQSFIDEDMWDEARIICNKELKIGDGLMGPVLPGEKPFEEMLVENDVVSIYLNQK